MGWKGPVTLRQLEAWDEWFHLYRQEPTDDQAYMMKLAVEIRRIYCVITGTPEPKDLYEFRVKWERRQQPLVKQEVHPAASNDPDCNWDPDEVAEAIWRARIKATMRIPVAERPRGVKKGPRNGS